MTPAPVTASRAPSARIAGELVALPCAALSDNPIDAVSHSRLAVTDAGAGTGMVNNGALRLSADSVKRSLLASVRTVTLSGTGQTVLHTGLQAPVGRQGQALSITVTSAVPEPASAALLLGGLATVTGVALRRRRAG